MRANTRHMGHRNCKRVRTLWSDDEDNTSEEQLAEEVKALEPPFMVYVAIQEETDSLVVIRGTVVAREPVGGGGDTQAIEDNAADREQRPWEPLVDVAL